MLYRSFAAFFVAAVATGAVAVPVASGSDSSVATLFVSSSVPREPLSHPRILSNQCLPQRLGSMLGRGFLQSELASVLSCNLLTLHRATGRRLAATARDTMANARKSARSALAPQLLTLYNLRGFS